MKVYQNARLGVILNRTAEMWLFAAFLLAFAVNALVPTQIITMDRYVLCIAFYIGFCAACLTAGSLIEKRKVTQNYAARGALIVLAAVLMHLAASFFVTSHSIVFSGKIYARGASFLLMNDYFFWAKPFDVLAQQVIIGILFFQLKRRGVGIGEMRRVFLILFGIPHAFQALLIEPVVGMSFFGMSLLGAILFPYLLMKFAFGPFYCYFLHLAAYSFAALASWWFLALV